MSISPTHWAIRGVPPAYDTPDEDVYLAGRNLVLLTKAGVVASKARAHRIALGPLAGNPFPDARPAFFTAMAHALSLGLDHQIEIATPFLTWGKEDVIKRGVELAVPFELTLSCMNPVAGERVQRVRYPNTAVFAANAASGVMPLPPPACSDPSTYANRAPTVETEASPLPRHCGLCSKCRERRDAFAAANVSDPSAYANRAPR